MIQQGEITRSWFVRCCYPGLQEFCVGTVFTDRDATEETARSRLIDLLDEVFPNRPELLSVEPGAIIIDKEVKNAGYAKASRSR